MTEATTANGVRVERDGPVATVILARPERRNAVDRPMADALADAFLKFERDQTASVAVLWGEGGTFCAGADLKAIAEGKAIASFRRTKRRIRSQAMRRWDPLACSFRNPQ